MMPETGDPIRVSFDFDDREHVSYNTRHDSVARARISTRIDYIRFSGNLGDAKSVGHGVSELRFFGPGYRVYFCRRGAEIVFPLGGGDKGSPSRDLRAAKALAKEV